MSYELFSLILLASGFVTGALANNLLNKSYVEALGKVAPWMVRYSNLFTVTCIVILMIAATAIVLAAATMLNMLTIVFLFSVGVVASSWSIR